MSFVIGPTERVVIVGRTGSGKSTLARAFTAGYSAQVVVDPKHEEQLARSIVTYSPRDFAQVYPQRSRRVIFRPDPEQLDFADVDEVIRRVLAYGRTVLVLHEVADFARAAWILPAYRRAVVTGRSLEVPTWSCTQRPNTVHNTVLSEAEHFFLFDLQLEGDRDKMAGIAGPGALTRIVAPHAFGYYGPSTQGELVRCDPLELPAGSPSPPAPGGGASGPSDDRQPGRDHAPGDGRHLGRQGLHARRAGARAV